MTGNLNGKCPFMRLSDGTVVCESVAMCRFLEEEVTTKYPEAPRLFGSSSKEAALVEMWVRLTDITYMTTAVGPAWLNSPLFTKITGKPVSDKRREGALEAADQFHSMVNKYLAEKEARRQGKFLCGECISMADIALYSIVDFGISLASMEVSAEYTHLMGWIAMMKGRKSAGIHKEIDAIKKKSKL
jgi:glutathione S-transferase